MKLYDKLPNEIIIDKKTYELDMSFDNILKILDMMKDKRLTDISKVMTGLNMLFKQVPTMPLDQLVEVWIKCLKELINRHKEEDDFIYDIKGNKLRKPPPEEREKTMDLSHDAELIYASFLQDYGIDLFEEQGNMHWYKFLSLLNGLSEDTTLKKIISIRQMPLPTGKGSEKHRADVERLKKLYALKESD